MKITLKVGPFVTTHHQQVMDEEAVANIHNYISDVVAPQANPHFTCITGSFYSHYDDPRYFGPLSVVKYCYSLNLTFHYATPSIDEFFLGELLYSPENGTFSEKYLHLMDRPSGLKWSKHG